MRLTISVDCDSLGVSPRERMEAGCALIASLAREASSTSHAAHLMSEHGIVPAAVHQSAPVGQMTLSSSSRVLFRGDLDGREVRVRRLSRHDLLAEGRRPAYREDEGDAACEARGDEEAMRAYELCIRSLLGDA